MIHIEMEDKMMKIAIGCDHGAYEYKEEIKEMLQSEGHEVIDCGTHNKESVDYPDFAQAVGKNVVDGNVDKGIVICGTGIGISIAANKIKGIRCGLCTDTTMARLTREHNDANVLAMGQRVIGIEVAKDIVHMFLNTEFSNGVRHARRIEKLKEMEEKW